MAELDELSREKWEERWRTQYKSVICGATWMDEPLPPDAFAPEARRSASAARRERPSRIPERRYRRFRRRA
jgi:hypothetical protein